MPERDADCQALAVRVCLVQLLNWNWKNKITPNGTPFLKSFLDKVRSGLFDFHQGEKVCPHRVAFIL